MTDALLDVASSIQQTLPINDLVWLVLGSVIAGLVRGFSGFGTAMAFLPFAGAVLPPVWALTVLVVMDIVGPLFFTPRTMKSANLKEVVRLGIGSLVALPVGVAVLVMLPDNIFRYAVSSLTLLLLLLLILGVRYRGELTKPLVYMTGGLGGFLAGAVGLPGPPVIMLYLASRLPVAGTRANIFLFLIIADIQLLAVFGFRNVLDIEAALMGVGLALPYLMAIAIGSRFFRPESETSYRAVAYLIIAGSAIAGAPLFDS